MSLELNTSEITQILRQINSFDFSQLEQLSTKTGIKDINSLWSLLQNGEDAVKTGNPNSIMNAIKSLITMLGTGESAAADREVKEKNKNLLKLEQESLKVSSENESKIKELINNISTNQCKIEEALKIIQELGGDSGVISKAKEELDKQVEIVEKNTEKLNNATTREERIEALNALKGASMAITNLVAEITVYQAQVELQVGTVESETKSIDESLTSITETIIDGQAKLSEYRKEGTVQVDQNTDMAGKGATDNAAGGAQTTAGSVMQSNAITAAEGQQLIRSGNDKLSAGAKRIPGAVANLTGLGTAINQISSNLGKLSEFSGAVGSVIGDVQNVIGQFNESLNPLITSFGSWEKVAAANAEFDQAITEYESNLGLEVEPEAPLKEDDEEKEDNEESNNFKSNTTLTFNFDANKFKAAFETKK